MGRGILFGTAAVMAVLALPAAASATHEPPAPLMAGAAEADITPPIGTPMFAYTARSRIFSPDKNTDLLQIIADPDPDRHLYAKTFVPSKGIHMRLRARAVVIERNGLRYALAQVDLGGIPHTLTQAVAARIAPHGISEERLLLSATHTHSAHGAIWPNESNAGYGVVGGDVFDERIFKLTVDGIVRAIARASRRRTAARIGVGHAELLDASRNRATEAYERNPDKTEIKVDPTVTVIRVERSDGSPVAAWSNFAIHPTSFGDDNLLFSGDNPGYTERIVEQAIGRGVVNVWTNGNEGDISPNGGADSVGGEAAQYVSGGFGGAHMAGARVARGVLQAWADAGQRMATDLPIAAKQSFLGFDGSEADGKPVGPLPVLGLGVVAENTCSPIEDLAGPGQGNKFPLYGGAGVPNVAPVSIWQIGDLAITALPSEVTKQMGARIRAAVLSKSGNQVSRVIMAGLSDGYISYTSTPEEYDQCAYEGSFTLFGRQQGARYRDFASALAGNLFLGTPAPAAAPEPAYSALGLDPKIPPADSPQAGSVTRQPADVSRFDRATFAWRGGDRSVDAPREETWVRLQRLGDDDKWHTTATEDSFADTVTRTSGDTYNEVFQFGPCDPVGSYRFQVTGRASRDGRVGKYQATSEPFTLGAATLTADQPAVSGDTVSVRARYPDPGAAALLALPRVVTTGTAKLRFGDQVVTALPDPQAGVFKAAVPAGATGAPTVDEVVDACGNATAGDTPSARSVAQALRAPAAKAGGLLGILG